MPAELALGPEEIRLLSNADYALGRLAGSAGRLVNPYVIGQPLLRREAILSSRIEGTFTTPEQLVLLEAGVAPAQDGRAAADTREVLNYVRAMERGLELLKTIPVSLRLLREIHGVLLDGVRGGEDCTVASPFLSTYVLAAGVRTAARKPPGRARPRDLP